MLVKSQGANPPAKVSYAQLEIQVISSSHSFASVEGADHSRGADEFYPIATVMSGVYHLDVNIYSSERTGANLQSAYYSNAGHP